VTNDNQELHHDSSGLALTGAAAPRYWHVNAVLSYGKARRAPILDWMTRVYNSARGRRALGLLESEQRLRILSDALQEYVIFELDPYGTVISWKPAPNA
jgi:hypothetical protein